MFNVRRMSLNSGNFSTFVFIEGESKYYATHIGCCCCCCCCQWLLANDNDTFNLRVFRPVVIGGMQDATSSSKMLMTPHRWCCKVSVHNATVSLPIKCKFSTTHIYITYNGSMLRQLSSSKFKRVFYDVMLLQ